VSIVGNKSTREKVIRRRSTSTRRPFQALGAGPQPGDLMRLGFFEEVLPDFARPRARRRHHLQGEGEDGRHGLGRAGYTGRRLTGFVEIGHSNVLGNDRAAAPSRARVEAQ